MKKIKLLYGLFFIALAIISCNDNGWMWEDPDLDIVVAEQGKTKIYKGGNVECSQIGDVLGISGLSFPESFKNDYNGTSFEFEWSELVSGLEVKVENGNTVHWWTPGTVKINGSCYKVGAVILKSATWSNIYYYGDGGAVMDKGLVTYTGQGLSNLTFCFTKVECEVPKIVIAAKTFYWIGYTGPNSWEDGTWASASEIYPFSPVPNQYCYRLGAFYYPDNTTSSLLKDYSSEIVGNVTVAEVWPEGVHSLKVTVELTLANGLMDRTYLYVGSLTGLLDSENLTPEGCPLYENWLIDPSDSKTHTFVIPYSSIK